MNPFTRWRKDVGCLWPAIGAASGVAALIALFGLGAFLRPARESELPSAPTVIRIPLPTSTPTSPPTPVVPTPTAAPTSEPSGEAFGVGDMIEVYGTSGEGVRLRSSPGLGGTINGLAMDSEVFQVNEGPVDAEGHVWWYLVNPYDTTRQGWAVAEYLRSLQSP
jgi:hypothetical protein